MKKIIEFEKFEIQNLYDTAEIYLDDEELMEVDNYLNDENNNINEITHFMIIEDVLNSVYLLGENLFIKL